MSRRCDEIQRELTEARTALLLELSEAPQALSGHSRVVDVEKAMDTIDLAIAGVRSRLMP